MRMCLYSAPKNFSSVKVSDEGGGNTSRVILRVTTYFCNHGLEAPQLEVFAAHPRLVRPTDAHRRISGPSAGKRPHMS